MRNIIDLFDGEYDFLSNFYLCKVNYNGIEYKHSEGAFQAQKTLNEQERIYIASLNPGQSKRKAGRHGVISLRADWEEIKDQIMYEVVLAKFKQNPDLREKLLNTDNAILIEGTTWHDNYWGNCTCNRCANKFGRNQLGKILMKVREELKG